MPPLPPVSLPTHDQILAGLLSGLADAVRPVMAAEDDATIGDSFLVSFGLVLRKSIALSEAYRASKGGLPNVEDASGVAQLAEVAAAWGGASWSDAILDSHRAAIGASRRVARLTHSLPSGVTEAERAQALASYGSAFAVYFWSWAAAACVVSEVVPVTAFAAGRLLRALRASADDAWSAIRQLELKSISAQNLQESLQLGACSPEESAMEAEAHADGEAVFRAMESERLA